MDIFFEVIPFIALLLFGFIIIKLSNELSKERMQNLKHNMQNFEHFLKLTKENENLRQENQKIKNDFDELHKTKSFFFPFYRETNKREEKTEENEEIPKEEGCF